MQLVGDWKRTLDYLGVVIEDCETCFGMKIGDESLPSLEEGMALGYWELLKETARWAGQAVVWTSENFGHCFRSVPSEAPGEDRRYVLEPPQNFPDRMAQSVSQDFQEYA